MISIAFDSHKRYTLCSVCDCDQHVLEECRIEHWPGAITAYLSRWPQGSTVAVETIGSWYWITDEIERAGMKAVLVHARRAKLMSGAVHKTDRLDARAINRLQLSGTLPVVWIATAQVRDRRELLRTRMVASAQRTRLKNRLHSVLTKYGLQPPGVSDLFGVRGRQMLEERLSQLPVHSAYSARQLLNQLEAVQRSISELDQRIGEVFDASKQRQLLRSLPGVGPLLSAVIDSEVGDVSRFASAARLASYSGTVPRTVASGGRVRHIRASPEVNRYLKWAFSEAANVVALGWRRGGNRHVDRLYRRLRARAGHSRAVGAVSRHLAEASWHMLSKSEPYKDPSLCGANTGASATTS